MPGYAYTYSGSWLSEQLFRGLLRVDRELNVVLDVAHECRVSTDGTVYRFRLRPDACWSDGVPVSADDIVISWRQTLERPLPAAPILEDVADVRALEDGTLQVRLRGPRSYFPYVLASSAAFPWPRHRLEELGDDWRRPEHSVSNGPFELAAFDDEHVLLRTNRAWPRARGNVAELHVEFGGRWIGPKSWDTGSYDFLFYGVGIEAAPETLLETTPMLNTIYIGFRGTGPPFDDERVRRAFAHGTDRERVAGLMGPETEPAVGGGVIPRAMPGHSHRLGLEHDVELARLLLADAGYPDGYGLPNISLFLGLVGSTEAADELARQWSQLGAHVEVKAPSFGEVSAAVNDGAADAWVWAHTADVPDPHGMLNGLLTLPFYRDAEILELLERARSLPDQDERMRLYREVERLWIAERAAIVPVGYVRETLVRRP